MSLPFETHARSTADFSATGLTSESLNQAVEYVYGTLDAIDAALVSRGSEPLAAMVELANLSSMIGNLLRTGVAKFSNGNFESNGPHKHPDLLHRKRPDLNVEIKVALEDNQPKGHLGQTRLASSHATSVLCAPDGTFVCGTQNRGCVPRIWLLRFGHLEIEHFNISNTEGDSGKTAVVNAVGMSLATTALLCSYNLSASHVEASQEIAWDIRAIWVTLSASLKLERSFSQVAAEQHSQSA